MHCGKELQTSINVTNRPAASPRSHMRLNEDSRQLSPLFYKQTTLDVNELAQRRGGKRFYH